MTDDQLTALYSYMEQRFEGFDKQFDRIDTQFDRIDAHFEKVDAQFVRIDGRLERLDTRVGETDVRIEALAEDVNRVYNVVDGIAKTIDDQQTEHAALTHQVDRHDRQLDQLAKHASVKLAA